jgi:hypothetical protein
MKTIQYNCNHGKSSRIISVGPAGWPQYNLQQHSNEAGGSQSEKQLGFSGSTL